MVNAIVLINIDRGHVNDVAQQLVALDGVTEVFSVAGRYDLVAVLRSPSNERIADLVTRAHHGHRTHRQHRDAAGVPGLLQVRFGGDVLDWAGVDSDACSVGRVAVCGVHLHCAQAQVSRPPEGFDTLESAVLM